MSVVRIQNAHKYYNRGKGNELHVMDNISLELPESGMIAIFGKSGCGKTTLLNAIGGLDRIQSGSIELFGQSIREDTDTVRNRYVGYIFQNYNLNVTDTIFENVAAALRLCGMTDEVDIAERVMAALANVGMDKYRDRTPDTLSGGQQQRVAIARALVKCPAIVLADEPTGNLDEANTVLVMDILKEISKTRLVLLVTHEAELVDFYCDRVIEIVDGRIVGDRQNSETRGYVRRDKNDIYLGELTRESVEAPGVRVEYYGEPTGELTLRIVSLNGKLYLKADGTEVKLLDDSSEIRLREGVFEEEAADSATKKTLDGRTWDMSRLTPVEGASYGRLYHFKNALVSAWRENFAKKQKRGRVLLRVCLFMLSVVMVFMTAISAAGIGSYVDLLEMHNESLFYVPVVPGQDYSALNEGLEGNGIEYTRLIGASPLEHDYLSFHSSRFITGSNVRLTAQARAQDIVHVQGLPVVAGTTELSAYTDIVLTTAVADKLIETTTVNYIDEYVDLIGMVSENGYATLGNGRLKIVGVVESDEVVYYMESLALTSLVLQNSFGLPVAPASTVGMENLVKPGEFIYTDNTNWASPTVGQSYRIMGTELTLTRIMTTKIDMEAYADYVRETYGKILPPTEVDGNPDFGAMLEEWLPYLSAYVRQNIDLRYDYQDVTFEEWLMGTHGHIAGAGSFLSVDAYYLCAAKLYHEAYGTYPATYEEAEAYASEVGVAEQIQAMLDVEVLYKDYAQYAFNRQPQSFSQVRWMVVYVLHDDDYNRLITRIGPTDDELELITYDDDYVYEDTYSHHLMIKSSDLAATEAFLRDTLGEGNYITPDAVLEGEMTAIRAEVILCVVSVLVILGLMCLCVYFIMRASFMSRVREVGILRAIGVTRRNLVYRFAVETGLLVSLTLLLGYILSFYFIASLSGAALFSELFFFPLWMGGGLLVVICTAAMYFGILPVLVLLRRTPSEILAKYDM